MARGMATNVGAIKGRRLKIVSFSPSSRLYFLGSVLLVSLTICSFKFSSLGAPAFMAPLAVACAAYLFAVREFFTSPKFPRRVLIIGLAFSAVWHVAFLRVPPRADDDIHRYIWDGRVQRLGLNPYTTVPSDPAVARMHTPETRTMNNPDVPSIYPAGAELFFRFVTSIQESTFALKVAFVACDFAIVFVLLDVLRSSGQPEHWALAYAWNPLLAIEVAGTGHIDILGALLLVVSFAALSRRWKAAAAVSLGLAISVKLLPFVLLPLYWKRIRARDAALAAAVVAGLYIPFLNHGRIPTGSLGAYVQSYRFNDPVFAMLERVVAPQLVAALAALIGLATAILWRRKSKTLSPDSFAWPMAASLFCAPVVYPWYLMWLIPFARSFSALPLLLWTTTILPMYVVWRHHDLGQKWLLPGWVSILEYGSVAVAAAMVAFRRPSPSTGTPYRSKSLSEAADEG